MPEKVWSATDRINIGSGSVTFKSDSSEKEFPNYENRSVVVSVVRLRFLSLKIRSVSVAEQTMICHGLNSEDVTRGQTNRGYLSRTRNIYSDMIYTKV